MGSLFPGQGLEPRSPPATKCQVPTPWTAREFPQVAPFTRSLAWPPWFRERHHTHRCSVPIFPPASPEPPWRQTGQDQENASLRAVHQGALTAICSGSTAPMPLAGLGPQTEAPLMKGLRPPVWAMGGYFLPGHPPLWDSQILALQPPPQVKSRLPPSSPSTCIY